MDPLSADKSRAHGGGMPAVDFDVAPFLVIWEVTQACDLACQHCRASAQPNRDTRELARVEAEALLTDVASMGTPVFIFSGGDPMKRPDLPALVRFGKDRGLRVGTIPAAVPALSRQHVAELKDAGLDQMAVSLDFPRADLHDGFRGVSGAFEKTMQAIAWAHEVGLPLQVNSTVCGDSFPYFGEMAEFVKELGIVFWEVFFLVPMGRGEGLRGLTADQCEEIFAILYRVQKEREFIVKVTEAPHYRRFVAQREAEVSGAVRDVDGTIGLPQQLLRSEGPGHTVGFAPRAVNAGSGFAFVSHVGDVFPSGFLPIPAGNVRQQPLSAIYRDSKIFRDLRNPDLLLGRCGRCEYKVICGGSRSRAYALTGNQLATDPWCAYEPGSFVA